MTDPYDLLPYTEHAYAESHPDHLRVVALLAGFTGIGRVSSVAPRVLELGCGRGGNLLPMAEAWPEATFVGVDRSAAQVKDATRVADAASLANVRFAVADFADDGFVAEPFDYVLCHGVYSWVPPTSRVALLRRVRASLTPGGLAYVSFNTLPGWYRKLAARDWLRFAARAPLASPTEAAGAGPREALDWLVKNASPELPAYRDDLRAVHARLVETDAAYLTHEYLAHDHHPVHVAEFLGEATAAGLAYVGDALPRESALELLPPEVLARIAGASVADALTVADFVRDTAFRRAVLARGDTAASLAFRPSERLDVRALVRDGALRVTSRLAPLGDAGASDVESFTHAGVTVQAAGPERLALRALAAVAPGSLTLDALAQAAGATTDRLADDLLQLALAAPGLDLRTREPRLTASPGERPRASGVARWHALEGGPLTNQWHEEVELAEPALRFVLSKLDGLTTRAELAHALRAHAKAGREVSEAEAAAVVTASLEALAKAALLVE